MAIQLMINGKSQSVDVPAEMPLLWVLRDTLGMTGTKFGCGMALCGACHRAHRWAGDAFVHHARLRLAGKKITTIEGLSPSRSHPVWRAWIEVDVLPRCGYCQSGQIMSASALPRARSEAQRHRNRRGHAKRHLPLRHLSAHPPGHPSRRRRCKKLRHFRCASEAGRARRDLLLEPEPVEAGGAA